jgi:Flp pilus assembly protein TadD
MPLIRFPQARQRVAWVAAAAFVAVLQLAGCAGHPTRPQGVSSAEPLNTYDRYLRIADKARKGGNFAMAASMYQRANALAPEKAEPIVGLAEMAAETGDLDRATALFAEAVRQAPNDASARRGYGGVLLQQNRPADAADQFLVAFEVSPTDVTSINGLGVSLDLLGEHEEAQRTYLEGLKQVPDNVSLHNNYALSLALSGNNEKAATLLRQIVADGNAGRRVRQNLALVYALAGRIRDAEAVVGTDLSAAEARNNLAFYESLQGLRGRSLAQAVFQAGFGATAVPRRQTKESDVAGNGALALAAPERKSDERAATDAAAAQPQQGSGAPASAAESGPPSKTSAVPAAKGRLKQALPLTSTDPVEPVAEPSSDASEPEPQVVSLPARGSEQAVTDARTGSDARLTFVARQDPHTPAAPPVVKSKPIGAAAMASLPAPLPPSVAGAEIAPPSTAAQTVEPTATPATEQTDSTRSEPQAEPEVAIGETTPPLAAAPDPAAPSVVKIPPADEATPAPTVASASEPRQRGGLAALTHRVLAFFGLASPSDSPSATAPVVALAPAPEKLSPPTTSTESKPPKAAETEVPPSNTAIEIASSSQSVSEAPLPSPVAAVSSAPHPEATEPPPPAVAAEHVSDEAAGASEAPPISAPTSVVAEIEPREVPETTAEPTAAAAKPLGLAELKKRLQVHVDRKSGAAPIAITGSWQDLEAERQRQLSALSAEVMMAKTQPDPVATAPAAPAAIEPPVAEAEVMMAKTQPDPIATAPAAPAAVEPPVAGAEAIMAKTDPDPATTTPAAVEPPVAEADPLLPTTAAEVAEDAASVRHGEPAAGGAYAVQVASLRSPTKAENLGEQLLVRHRDVLSDYRFILVRADLGARGTFFRVRVGPFVSRSQADDLCTVLSGRKIDCLVVATAS